MTIYEKAKGLATAREAAEHYGLTVDRRGMALCPFHDDHHPSMKVDERFHCFACGEDGDAIDLVAKLFNFSVYEAAEKLIREFGDGELPDGEPDPREKTPEEQCHDVLLELEILLRRQKRESVPTDREAPIPSEYAESCQMYDFIVCLADLLSGGTEQERKRCVEYLTGGVLEHYEKALQKGVIGYRDIF